ncbi:MAG: hypothetical protein K2G46_07415 [Bacteroidales bacterium]|nr:hypothetical protein [Bacteroidales bacterium]
MKTKTLCAVLLISSLLCGLPLSAQNDATTQTSSTEQTGDQMTKKDMRRAQRANWKPEDFLPKAGSWALSINANPFLNPGYIFGDYDAGGAVGGSAYLSPVLSIAGKYMVTDNLGIRLNIGWLYHLESEGAYTRDDMAYRADRQSTDKVVDRCNYHNAGASFNVAAEYRIGKRRVQGVVGGGLIYAFDYKGINYSYGNAITPDNPSPSTSRFGRYYYDLPDDYSFARYIRSVYGNPTHYLGLMGFVGVEWFISPWFSLGAEVNVAAVYNWTQNLYQELEGFNQKTKQRETWREEDEPGSRGFTFGTGNFGANFNLTFYFNRNKK